MERTVRLVDAFTDEPTTGNAAGVVHDAADLTDDQMQAIARELGASETAFLSPCDDATRRIRYFTPDCEVALCGHATVAAFASLFSTGAVDAGAHAVATNAGVLDVQVDADGTVWLAPETPSLREVDVEYEAVADALGVDVASLRDVGADLPLVRGSTGPGFLLVPVNYFEHLRDASPDQRAIQELADAVDAAGVYAFTFDTLAGDATLHARCFVPGAGIPEDPVTETASAAVGAYLEGYGALDADVEEIVCEQGHFLDRPGRVRVRIDGDVQVGGRATTTVEGTVTVPEPEDDDIIEA